MAVALLKRTKSVRFYLRNRHSIHIRIRIRMQQCRNQLAIECNLMCWCVECCGWFSGRWHWVTCSLGGSPAQHLATPWMTSALHLHFAELSIKCLEQSAVLLGKVVQHSQVPSTNYRVWSTQYRVPSRRSGTAPVEELIAADGCRSCGRSQVGSRARPTFGHQSNLDKEQIQFWQITNRLL